MQFMNWWLSPLPQQDSSESVQTMCKSKAGQVSESSNMSQNHSEPKLEGNLRLKVVLVTPNKPKQVRRSRISTPTSFRELERHLVNLFNLESVDEIRFIEERKQDWITIANNGDVQNLVTRIAQRELATLQIKSGSKQSSTKQISSLFTSKVPSNEDSLMWRQLVAERQRATNLQKENLRLRKALSRQCSCELEAPTASHKHTGILYNSKHYMKTIQLLEAEVERLRAELNSFCIETYELLQDEVCSIISQSTCSSFGNIFGTLSSGTAFDEYVKVDVERKVL